MKRGSISNADNPVSADDKALFREAVGAVRRIEAEPAPQPTPPKPRAHQLEADERTALETSRIAPFALDNLEVGEELIYLKQGQSSKVLRRLRGGQYAIQDELDLHQMNIAVATAALRDFLASAQARGLRCVRIIHGKGLRSRTKGPVLKHLTDRFLRQRNEIIAFASARPVQGGTGAVVVLLARRRAP